MGGAKFGGAQISKVGAQYLSKVGAQYLPLLPHCICSWLSTREIRWRAMFLLPLTLGLKVRENTWI